MELKTKLELAELPLAWLEKIRMIEDNGFNKRIVLTKDSREYKEIEDEYKKTSGKGTI
jgi:hypothetical protein